MLVTFHYRMFYLTLCYKKNLDKNTQNCMSVVLYGCETWTLSHWWKIIDLVWEQCAEEDIWTCQGRKCWETGDNYVLHSFTICTVTKYYYDQIREYVMCQAYSIHGRKRNAARVLVINPEKQHLLESPKYRWKVMLQWTWKKQDWRVGIWPIWLRGQFSIRIIQTFGCHKRQQVFSLLKQLLASMRQANFIPNTSVSLCDVCFTKPSESS